MLGIERQESERGALWWRKTGKGERRARYRPDRAEEPAKRGRGREREKRKRKTRT